MKSTIAQVAWSFRSRLRDVEQRDGVFGERLVVLLSALVKHETLNSERKLNLLITLTLGVSSVLDLSRV